VARRTGARTRSRFASEAPSTMWLGKPYNPEAASQSVAMVTQRNCCLKRRRLEHPVTVGRGCSYRNISLAGVDVASEGQEDGAPYTPSSPVASEATSRARRTDRTYRNVLTLPTRTWEPWVALSRESRPACGQCYPWGGAFIVVGDRESLSHGEGRQLSSSLVICKLRQRRDV
jgi:hypothetical protein